jgi:anti-sigma B factor antagonist
VEELGGEEAKAWMQVSVDGAGVSVVELGGELDMSNVGQAQQRLADLIQTRPQRLIFDLAGITFMDSSGLGLLVSARRESESMEIRRASAIAQRVIEATGLAEYFGLDAHDQ